MTRCPQRGFSLLELLVALFVVVILTALATLNVGSGTRELELESQVRSLADISAYVLDEAQMNGVDMGLLFERVNEAEGPVFRYSWLERHIDGWGRIQRESDIFGEGEFPPRVVLNLELEDLPVPELAPAEAGERLLPQVVLYASGETTPGVLELRDEDSAELLWLLEWDLLGRFTPLLPGERFDEQE